MTDKDRYNQPLKALKEGRELTCHKPFWARIINYLLKGSDLMGTLAELVDGIDSVVALVEGIDTDLDVVKAKLDELSAGQPVSQEQLDSLIEKVVALKEKTASVKQESDDLA